MTPAQRQYREVYLRSPEWAATKARYRASKMPQTCVVCGESRVDLHHRTYVRVGRERLADLVPLCRAHHREAHVIREAQKRPNKKKATAKQLAWIRDLGGTPKPEMTDRQARRMTAVLHRQRNQRRKMAT